MLSPDDKFQKVFEANTLIIYLNLALNGLGIIGTTPVAMQK